MDVNNSNYTNDKARQFNTYLNKVIVFSSKEFYRREATRNFREPKIIDEDDYNENMTKLLSYNEEYDFDETNIIDECENKRLINAVKQLSSIEKAVIFLLFSKELNRNQIAKALNICCDTVSRVKLRALKKLTDYLKGEL